MQKKEKSKKLGLDAEKQSKLRKISLSTCGRMRSS